MWPNLTKFYAIKSLQTHLNMFCRVCNISVGLCLRKQAEICPKNVVTKNPELCKICDRHVFHSDLYFSIWVTKLDAVKGSNRTYPYSKESVKLWWVYAWENMQKSVPKVLQPKFQIYAKFAIDINCILTSIFPPGWPNLMQSKAPAGLIHVLKSL